MKLVEPPPAPPAFAIPARQDDVVSDEDRVSEEAQPAEEIADEAAGQSDESSASKPIENGPSTECSETQ